MTSLLLNALILIEPWDGSGNQLIGSLSILFIGWGIWAIYKKVDLQLDQPVNHSPASDYHKVAVEQEKFLQSLSHQRHDWLNHFQVLLGYLKLQRYDVCEDYIKKVTENTNNDSRIAALGYRPLVAYLLTFNALHKELTVEVELPDLIDLRSFSEEENTRIYALIKRLVDTYLDHAENGQANTLLLLIQRLEESLYVSVDFEGDLDDQGCLTGIYQLVDEFGNEEGFFVEGLHNNKESIMEFYLPINQGN